MSHRQKWFEEHSKSDSVYKTLNHFLTHTSTSGKRNIMEDLKFCMFLSKLESVCPRTWESTEKENKIVIARIFGYIGYAVTVQNPSASLK